MDIQLKSKSKERNIQGFGVMKDVRVVLSEDAEQVYQYLKDHQDDPKKNGSILRSVQMKADHIKRNPHFGNPISKKIMPSKYQNKYGLKNLFRIELSGHWRMLYTLTNGETSHEIVVFILDIMDHEDYNKLFGYSKK
jgi:hypothetical protein